MTAWRTLARSGVPSRHTPPVTRGLSDPRSITLRKSRREWMDCRVKKSRQDGVAHGRTAASTIAFHRRPEVPATTRRRYQLAQREAGLEGRTARYPSRAAPCCAVAVAFEARAFPAEAAVFFVMRGHLRVTVYG